MSPVTRMAQRLTYIGHFLHNSVDDNPGHVAGQGGLDVFVATPT